MTADFRKQFSFFATQNAPVYLDSAATTQKLNSVLDRSDSFARHQNASVHRSAYPLAHQATKAYELARTNIARLINAYTSDEIIFTSGATESINLIAQGIQPSMLSGSSIAICQSEHHANILPWQQVARRLNLNIVVLPLEKDGRFTQDTMNRWMSLLDEQVAIFACAQVSNVLGNIYPIAQLCRRARETDALSVIDGTQALAHMQVDVQSLACDFYVFSGHKMYAPNGVGVCWGKLGLLNELLPTKLGGEMVVSASFERYTHQSPPLKFEAGTPNTAGAIAFDEASRFIRENMGHIVQHETQLSHYLYKALLSIKGLRLLGNWGLKDASNAQGCIGLFSFYIDGIDNHALATALYAQNIAIRYGQHCAMPLFTELGIDACLRVSLGCYNDTSDVDSFLVALSNSIDIAIDICKPEQSLVNKTNAGARPAIPSAPVDAIECEFDERVSALRKAKNWPDKHRQLLLLSKSLPILAQEHRTASNEVMGCEAKVWLAKNAVNKLEAYSSSKVIRGILALIVAKYNQLAQHDSEGEITDSALTSFDYAAYLHDLGLNNYFSEGRKDGIKALIRELQSLSISNI